MSDLISRSALIKKIRDYADEVGCVRGEYELANGILKAISVVEDTPTVEAKPVVHGEWIDTQPDYHPGCGNNAHVCSICGDYYTTEPEDLFFCPRCSADMRKKVE